MNLTEDIKNQIVSELKTHNLPDNLMDAVVDVMSKQKVNYKQAIKQISDKLFNSHQSKSAVNNGFSGEGETSFESRLKKTSEAVQIQVIRSLIEAEQSAYQRYFSGDYDPTMFPMGGEITGHSVMSSATKALIEA